MRWPGWRVTIAAAVAALVLWRLWYLRVAGHWDFMTYYWAAKAQGAGLDPYSLQDLSRVAGQKIVLPYLYPPGVLYFLRPFTWLSLHGAIILYASLKAMSFVALLLLWRACLGPRNLLPLVILVVFGFSDAVFNDFFAGNIATFEALVLWVGFWAFLRQRVWWFAVLVVLASVAKLTPLAFLVLVLLTTHRRRLLIFLGGIGVTVLSVLASFGGSFIRFASYLRILFAVDERGPTNTAMLPLLKEVLGQARQRYHVAPPVPAEAVYFGLALLAVGFTGWVMVRIRRHSPLTRDTLLDYVMGAVLLYAFAVPRCKDYSYLLILPAVVFVGRRIGNALPLLILLACLTTRNTFARYALDDFPLADFVWRYFNLIIAAVLWAAFVSYAWGRGRPPVAAAPAAPAPPASFP